MCEIELIKGICPKCGEKTTFIQHSSDSGMCGGNDYWTDEDCTHCGLSYVDFDRKREKQRRENEIIKLKEELKETAYQKKLKYYKKYYE